MTDFVVSTAALMIRPKGQPIFSEQVTTVRIEDESGGCFIEVEQEGEEKLGKIQITIEEWPAIKSAIESMLETCKAINAEQGD